MRERAIEQAQEEGRGTERAQQSKKRKKKEEEEEEAERRRKSQEEGGGECSVSGQHFHACVQGLCEYTMGCIGSRRLSKQLFFPLSYCGIE